MITLVEIGIDLFVIMMMILLGFIGKSGGKFPLFFLIAGLASLFSLGLIAAGGTIAYSQYFNGASLQYVTIAVYPFPLFMYAIMTVACFVLLIESV